MNHGSNDAALLSNGENMNLGQFEPISILLSHRSLEIISGIIKTISQQNDRN